ncbi:MAG TPA: PilN domain-containing protein [Solirubrobacteraceae bacterium]|nr:PilN domain-containing protein [Solirubrobacteraceae bacterium]
MKAINLLPPDSRGLPKSGAPKVAAAPEEPAGIGAFVLLGALALCVAAFAAYVLTTNTVKDRQAQLDAVTVQAQTVAQRAAELKPYADFQQMAETRIQTVKDLAASRFDWEQALRDISRAIPADVTLTSLDGSISSDAGGSSTVRGAIAAPAIELQGCTRSQTQVATLLSRLRSVDGVTRVTLQKSVKPDQQTTTDGSTVPAAAGTTQAVCGAGRPPSFELVMFFERSEVPSSVSDITVQTSSSAATPAAGEGTTGAGTTETTTQDASGVTTPPADPAEADGNGTATPASTPQGEAAQ